MKEAVWVVGCAGLVGKEMVKFVQEKGISCIGSTSEQVDVTDIESIRSFCKKHRPTHIINCSAHVHVDQAEKEERELAFAVNVTGVENLAEIAKEQGVHLIHIGTDYVFDGEKDSQYSETDEVNPINIYGLTKLQGEQRMLEIYPSAVCVRTASLYGKEKPGLVTYMIKALETQDEVLAIVDQVSTPTYVTCLVRAIWDIRNEKGIFHFVNKGHASRLDLARELMKHAETAGKKIKCTRLIGVKDRDSGRAAKRPHRSVLSTKKIEPYLSQPILSWQAALSQYLKEIGWDKRGIS